LSAACVVINHLLVLGSGFGVGFGLVHTTLVVVSGCVGMRPDGSKPAVNDHGSASGAAASPAARTAAFSTPRTGMAVGSNSYNRLGAAHPEVVEGARGAVQDLRAGAQRDPPRLATGPRRHLPAGHSSPLGMIHNLFIQKVERPAGKMAERGPRRGAPPPGAAPGPRESCRRWRRRAPRVRSHCRFRNRGTAHVSKYGAKWNISEWVVAQSHNATEPSVACTATGCSASARASSAAASAPSDPGQQSCVAHEGPHAI
jgi:hypothetical protein